jgi:hypothetical protein
MRYSSTSKDRNPENPDKILDTCKDLTRSLLGKSDLNWSELLDLDLTPWFNRRLKENERLREKAFLDSTEATR